jgi:hypothetical protein
MITGRTLARRYQAPAAAALVESQADKQCFCRTAALPLPVAPADLMVDPVVSKCGHDFCRFCMEQVFNAARRRFTNPSCPVCRTALARQGGNTDLGGCTQWLFRQSKHTCTTLTIKAA